MEHAKFPCADFDDQMDALTRALAAWNEIEAAREQAARNFIADMRVLLAPVQRQWGQG